MFFLLSVLFTFCPIVLASRMQIRNHISNIITSSMELSVSRASQHFTDIMKFIWIKVIRNQKAISISLLNWQNYQVNISTRSSQDARKIAIQKRYQFGLLHASTDKSTKYFVNMHAYKMIFDGQKTQKKHYIEHIVTPSARFHYSSAIYT